MNAIETLSLRQQNLVVARTVEFIRRAEGIFARKFETIPVYFDLKGRSAGMYRIQKNRGQIRYNPFIFARYFDDNLATTVPHEVAHYICDAVYGLRNIRPHGREWKGLMARFGADASRTCDYDLSGFPLRTTRRHSYACACSKHLLTSIRHNRVQRGQARYVCRKCRGELIAAD
ncbi:MAG: SprT family zinc-dependent metalloprotease [Gammaproteobacteria bacterium]